MVETPFYIFMVLFIIFPFYHSAAFPTIDISFFFGTKNAPEESPEEGGASEASIFMKRRIQFPVMIRRAPK